MTLTVTEYRHDDTSAPVLDGSVGSLITVLQACLVDGYGAKSPAGWTKPLSDTGRAAFVNNTTDGGTGCYVYVDDNAPSAEGARSASIRTYTTMSDIDTGTYGTNEAWFRKSNTEDSTARPWILWADGLTFYLYVSDTGDSGIFRGRMAGAGDYACYDATNAYRFFAMGSAASGSVGSHEWARYIDDIPHPGFEVMHIDGLSGAITGTILYRGVEQSTPTDGNCGTNAADATALGGAVLALAELIQESQQSLGRLRGAYSPMHRLYGVYAPAEEIGSTGLIFTPVNATTSSGGAKVGALPVDRQGPW